MRKSTVLLISIGCLITVTWLAGCQSKETPDTQLEGQYFKFLQAYPIPDSAQVDLAFNPTDFEIVSPDHIFLTTPFTTRRILETALPLREFKQVGREGLGPGEYARPMYIAVDRQMLYYSDTGGVIKSIPLPDNPGGSKQQTYMIPSVSGGDFAVRFPYLAVLNNNAPYISLFKLEANGRVQLLKTFLKFEDYYGIVNRHANGGGIVFDSSGTLYVMPVAPYVISSFRIQDTGDSVAVKRIHQFNLQASLQGSEYFKPWTRKKYTHTMQLENRQRLDFLSGAATTINHCWILEHGNQQALLVDFYTHMENGKKIHSQYVLQVISLTDGRVIHTYYCSMPVLGVYRDVVYFYHSSKTEPLKISTYRWLGYN